MIIWAIAQLVNAYTIIIFVYVLLSWFPSKQGFVADLDHALGRLCEPYLQLFRKFIPPIGGMLDISPIVAILALQLIVQVLFWLF